MRRDTLDMMLHLAEKFVGHRLHNTGHKAVSQTDSPDLQAGEKERLLLCGDDQFGRAPADIDEESPCIPDLDAGGHAEIDQSCLLDTRYYLDLDTCLVTRPLEKFLAVLRLAQ